MSHRIHGTLLSLGETALETVHGRFTAQRFGNFLDRRPLIALTRGDVGGGEPLLARVHSSCITSEAFDGCDCDCAEQLSQALAEVAAAGRGVVFYLMQEGRGAGFAAKARDRMLVQASGHRLTTFEAYERMGLERDLRRYDEVGFAARLLGIHAPLRLLTNNPDKVAALRAAGVAVETLQQLPARTSTFNVHYIDAKRRSGHALDDELRELRPAEPPAPVESFDPHPLDGDLSLFRIAAYLLPVRVDGENVAWFQVHVYYDVNACAERVVLTYGDLSTAVPLVCLHEENLLDRFPLRRPGAARRRWRVIVREILRHGAGCALFLDAEAGPIGDARRAAALVASHLVEGRAHPVLGRRPRGSEFWDALREEGIEIERRVLLDEIS